MKFYFAGKVGFNDWRHTIVDGLSDALHGLLPDYDPSKLPEQWPIYRHSIFGQHDYTGPYFISRDGLGHYPTHGRNQHGSGVDADELSIQDFRGNSHDLTRDALRTRIVVLCLQAIAAADVVFAWVDQPSAYGTLTEIGFARAMRKSVWWAQPPHNYELDDLWFAQTMATQDIKAPSAKEGLEHYLKHYQPFTRDGYIYVLQSGQHYKIGKAQNVDNRVAQISPKTPLPVSLIHSIESDDMTWVERWLHQRFANYRANGEWFNLPAAALSWLLDIKVLLRRNLEAQA